jgi:hypothetical protein
MPHPVDNWFRRRESPPGPLRLNLLQIGERLRDDSLFFGWVGSIFGPCMIRHQAIPCNASWSFFLPVISRAVSVGLAPGRSFALFADRWRAGLKACKVVDHLRDVFFGNSRALALHPGNGLGPGILVFLAQGIADSLGIMADGTGRHDQ